MCFLKDSFYKQFHLFKTYLLSSVYGPGSQDRHSSYPPGTYYLEKVIKKSNVSYTVIRHLLPGTHSGCCSNRDALNLLQSSTYQNAWLTLLPCLLFCLGTTPVQYFHKYIDNLMKIGFFSLKIPL